MHRGPLKNVNWILRLLLISCVSTGATSLVRADAGTPLMWATGIQLVIGNAIIGAMEGLCLTWFFDVPPSSSVPVMVVANYTSACVGGFCLALGNWRGLHVSLYAGRFFLLLAVVASFLLTVVLEWPFVWFCLRRQAGSRIRSLRASFVLQAVSYGILVPYFYAFSATSLYSLPRMERSLSFVHAKCATCYYISIEDGDIYRRKLGEDAPEKIADANLHDSQARLYMRRGEDRSAWDLWALNGSGWLPTRHLVLSAFARRAASFGRSWGRKEEEPETWLNFGPAANPGEASEWEFSTGFWPVQGLLARSSGHDVRLALETPFLRWPARSATALPGGQVLFQLADHICVFDPVTRQLALVTDGRGPVVTLDACPP